MLPRVYMVMKRRKAYQKLLVKLLVPMKWIKKKLKVLTPDDQLRGVKSLDMKDPSQENQRPSDLEALCLMRFSCVLIQATNLSKQKLTTRLSRSRKSHRKSMEKTNYRRNN